MEKKKITQEENKRAWELAESIEVHRFENHEEDSLIDLKPTAEMYEALRKGNEFTKREIEMEVLPDDVLGGSYPKGKIWKERVPEEKHMGHRYVFWKWGGYGIAAAVLLLLGFGIGLYVSSDIRARRMPSIQIVEQDEQTDTYQYEGAGKDHIPDRLEKRYELTGIPEGFVLTKEDEWFWGISQIYSKGNKQIVFTQDIASGRISFDNEEMDKENVMIDGYIGRLYTKPGEVILFWATDEYVFNLIGDNVDKDLIIQLAETMKEKK